MRKLVLFKKMSEAAVGIERRLVAETFRHAVQARQLGHLAAPHEETGFRLLLFEPAPGEQRLWDYS